MLDFWLILCYNTGTNKRGANTMMYLIDTPTSAEVFSTYAEAEEYCWHHAIHPEEIVEISPEEAEEIRG